MSTNGHNSSPDFSFPWCTIKQPALDCRITAYTQTSALGCGLGALREALEQRASGLRPNDFDGSGVPTWIGRVWAVDDHPVEDAFRCWESRNNILAAIGFAQDGFPAAVSDALSRFGAWRVGVIVGTSTSSVGRTEAAYRDLEDGRFRPEFRQPLVHNPHSPGIMVAELSGAQGPCMTISTACASSAKVFASAHRWLRAGLVDAVIVGGVDSLCHSVLAGFASLELTAPGPCRPFDTHREGINLGEAAGFALVMRADDAPAEALRLAGYGESSDAFHMSQPPPDGEGARRSMCAALVSAGLDAAEIDYANLHGTASRANDAAEAQALHDVFPDGLVASSTKGWTGHTLGAAGMLEAVIAMDSLITGLMPGTLNLERPDPGLPFPIATDNRRGEVRHVLSNSFGFGGNNCSLVFSRVV